MRSSSLSPSPPPNTSPGPNFQAVLERRVKAFLNNLIVSATQGGATFAVSRRESGRSVILVRYNSLVFCFFDSADPVSAFSLIKVEVMVI